ncbi:MAG: hypothetical protein ACI84K_000757, partial [Pseudohongiellaceae bacterium]
TASLVISHQRIEQFCSKAVTGTILYCRLMIHLILKKEALSLMIFETQHEK